ncbi:MAG: adenylate/guanylate cyclase domain-containing protein [Actinomycetia bacterium]|nr:adenylate/guanylate cyclase domain-containing protein [Actinomycetes bacterium]MCH9710571.1 adenylate/guanylate cyclase domain-containing protein [Actinomycetes bacterium]
MTDGRLRYARNGDVRLAYRVFGTSGPFMIWVPGWMLSNVDTIDDPGSPYAEAVDLFSQSTRFIVWDRRGTGLSDPSTQPLSIDQRIDDVRAILDAAGADRAAFFGTGEGGSMSLLFAATHPQRVRSLALFGTAARYSQKLPDFPWGFTPGEVESQLNEIDSHWGEGALADLFYGSTAETPGVKEMFGKLQRAMVSPTTAKLWWKAIMEIDVRDALASVRAPTLVLARPGDRLVSIEAAAALTKAIPGAQLHPMPPGSHALFDIVAELVPSILEFVCLKPSEPTDERLLKTVMFTDIVSSTESLSVHGDAHWRHQLDAHDKVIDALLGKYDGHRAKHTGDGVFALFDGPTKAARCALDLVPALAARGFRIRAGVHIGECERRGEEWSGVAVHIGARIGALADAGEVLASRTVRDLSAGSGLTFESLGPQHLKGLPDEVDVYRVTNRRAT